MSIFFTKITDTFDNQKREKDFVKEDNHYKDKTFFFDLNDQNPKTNCFLSYNNEKNFELLFSLYKSKWIENWEKNKYNNCETLYIQEQDLELSFDILQKFSDLKNISKENWKKNWKNIIKNNKDKHHKLVPKLFNKIFKEKMKQKYSDKSKFLKIIDKIIDYKSVGKMKQFKIFENKIDCTNIEQGQLGTCYFLAAISTISNYGQLLYQLFPQEKINPEGLYEICLYHKGRWVKVLVDDYFPFIKNTDTFLWTHPINNCLYTCFLEKAYAKINGSYNDINGGHLCPAFESLTGFESFVVKKKERTLSSEKIYEIKDEVYEYFYNKITDGYLFSCATWDHAYSLMAIDKENNQFIFKVRNPWNCETSFKDGTFGLLSYNKIEYEKKFAQTAVCPVLFNTSIYFYDLSKIEKKYNYQFYLYFQTYNENSKITAGLTKIGLNERLSIKLKDMTPKDPNKKNEIILISFNEIKNKISELLKNFSSNDFNNYTDIGKSKYLLKIDLSNVSNETLKNEKLKVIISGNINLRYLGYLPYEPKIDSNEIKIEYKKYNYGEKTGEIFKNYKTIKELLEKEFNVKMHSHAKGYYIETIFTDEVETIVRFDKAKLQNQICSYDKKGEVFFTGNKHEEGKIVGSGKILILKENKSIKIYEGEINKNKICCELLNLDKLSGEAILKIPKITNFEKSMIESKVHHEHKLKYTKAGVNWKCDKCKTTFGQNTYSFACRECNFNLCLECMFPIKDLKKKNNNKDNMDNIKLKEKTIPNGVYSIQSAHFQNKIQTIHLENNNLIVGDMKDDENKQKFNIKYDLSHKCYTIQNVENCQFLTCDDSTIYFNTENNNINQQWHIPYDSFGYEIVLAKNKKLLQVEENAINGSRVSCQEKNRKSNQIFKFISTTVIYFPRPNWHPPYINQVSIVDALASIGYPYDQEYRLKIGKKNKIPGTPYSPEYNTYMLDLMKEGKLIIP